MRKFLFLIVIALVIGGLFAACGGGSLPVSVKSGVIRLHILANSDSDADQATKLLVRDMLLNKWGMQLKSAETSSDAWKTLNTLLPDIKNDVNDFLSKNGASYSAAAKSGVYDFPERDYEGIAFPAGKYRALRIELGAATGHNWWCVMFPPLCLIGEKGEMSIEQYKDLVKSLDEQGVQLDNPPEAPVRSWLFDQLFGNSQWDKDFLQWAKDFWLGGDNK